jgi:hypothetical protein
VEQLTIPPGSSLQAVAVRSVAHDVTTSDVVSVAGALAE